MKRPSARRGVAPIEETPLQRRHRELLTRYQALVARLNEGARSRSAFQWLSWFALQRSSSALALYRDGRVILANPRWHTWSNARAAVLGWSVGEGTRQRHYDELGSLGAAELVQIRRGQALTLLARRRDGKQVLRIHVERADPPGEAAIGLVVADDITAETARKAEVAELRQTVKKREQMSALGRMAAGLAHDLGNTLNALSLRIQHLSRTSRIDDPAALGAIDEAVDMMRLTLDRLDRFSGRRSRPLKPVPLRGVLRSAIGVAGLRPGHRPDGAPPIKVVLELPRRLPRVLADAAELTNVFVNLLINACDAMPSGGRITIDATVGPRHVSVRVCDEGPGFSPEHLARAFEPFFSTKGARGRGLGLSLAYGFMEAIGGTIRAGNRKGGGGELLLVLPIAQALP